MNPLINRQEIIQYIPQRTPIIMVDEVLTYEEAEITTNFEIREENLFILNGRMTESGLIENIAQTAAAKAGYTCHLKQVPVPLGFIGAVSKVLVHGLPPLGSRIETQVTIKNDVMGVTIVSGRSELDGELLIECEMKIIIQQD